MSTAHTETIKFEPHPSAITNAGEYAYHANGGRTPLAYAIGEFMDNSLSATKGNLEQGLKRSISITFVHEIVAGNKTETILCISDNGCGMHVQQLQEFATYGLDPKRRGLREEIPSCVEENDTLYLNSRISQFGVGSKQAAFFIGDQFFLLTKPKDRNTVSELYISKHELNSRWEDKKNVYEDEVLFRKPGKYEDSRLKQLGLCGSWIRRKVSNEAKSAHFTDVVISGLKKDHIRHFLEMHNELCKDICHVYHYYIHGATGISDEPSPEKLKTSMKLEVVVDATTKNSYNLMSYNEDLESLYYRKSKSVFEFRMEKHDSKNPSKQIIVKGRLFYFPFLFDRETMPLHWSKDLQVVSDDLELDVEDEYQNMFECFWQGRLIPYTRLRALKFMEFGNRLVHCRRRVRGVLFFNDSFGVTQNKLTFCDDLETFLIKSDAIFESASNINVSKSRSIVDAFKDWIQKCNQQFDLEMRFTNPLSGFTDANFSFYACMSLENRTYKPGSLIAWKKATETVFGKVLRFKALKEEFKGKQSRAGSSFAVYHRLPFSVYRDVEYEMDTFYMDKQTSDADMREEYESMEERELSKVPQEIEVLFDGNESEYLNSAPAGYIFPGTYVKVLGHAFKGKRSILTNHPSEKKKFLVVKQVIQMQRADGNYDVVDDGINISSAPYSEKKHYFYAKRLLKSGNYQIKFEVDGFAVSLVFHCKIDSNSPKTLSIIPNEISGKLNEQIDANIKFFLYDEFGNSCNSSYHLQDLRISSKNLKISNLKYDFKQFKILSFLCEMKSKNRNQLTRKSSDEHEILCELGGVTNTIKYSIQKSPPSAMKLDSDLYEGREDIENRTSLSRVKIVFLDSAGLEFIPDLCHVESVTCKLAGSDGSIISSGESSVTVPIDLSGSVCFDGLFLKLDSKKFKNRNNARASLIFSANAASLKKRIPDLILKLDVKPSSKPVDFALEFPNALNSLRRGNTTHVKQRVGSRLDVKVTLKNECGDVVIPTSEDVDILNGRIKSNWFREYLVYNQLSDNSLPFIPTSKKVELREYQISFEPRDGEAMQASFEIKTVCDSPVRCKMKLPKLLKCGEPFGENVCIWLEDQFKNRCDLSMLSSSIKLVLSEACESIGNWEFATQDEQIFIPKGAISAPCGRYELTVEDSSNSILPFQAKFELTFGNPHHLELKIGSSAYLRNLDMEVESRHRMENLSVRVCDVAGNICNDLNGSSIILESKNPNAFVFDHLNSAKGRCSSVSFPIVGGLSNIDRAFFVFSAMKLPCNASFVLKVSNSVLAEEFNLLFHVAPSLDIVYGMTVEPLATHTSSVVGGKFPSYKCSLVGENGLCLPVKERKEQLRIVLFDCDNIAVENAYSEIGISDDNLHFLLSNNIDAVIKKSGKYSLAIKYVEERPNLCTLLHPSERSVEKVADFKVRSGKVYRLGFIRLLDNVEDFSLSHRHFNASSVSVWVLSERVCLSAFDDDGNLCEGVFSSSDDIQIRIRHQNEEAHVELSHQFSVEIIDNGNKLLLKNFVMRPNSLSHFEVLLKGVSKNLSGALPCKIIVQTSDNADTAEEINKLRVALQKLEENIKFVNNNLTKAKEEAKVLSQKYYLLNQEVNRLRSLFGDKFAGMDLSQVETLGKSLIEKIKSEPQDMNRSAPYRMPSHVPAQIRDIHKYQGGIGLFGLLATTNSSQVSRILSWQSKRYSLTPIVESENTEAGKICVAKDYQKLCLDLTSQPNFPSLPHGNIALPKHITERPSLAVSLLKPAQILQDRLDVFQKVFISVFRGLIVMNTYDQAYLYRKWVTQDLRKDCPNIVTLDGQLLLSTGITGGKGNRCPNDIESVFPVESTAHTSNSRQNLALLESLLKNIADLRLLKNDAKLMDNNVEVIMNEDQELRKQQQEIYNRLKSLNGSVDPKRRMSEGGNVQETQHALKKSKNQ